MSQELENRCRNLRRRSALFAKVRQFFQVRGFIEVDCPALSQSASVDEHIDLIPARFDCDTHCYLHSSPELGMKRLLCDGIGDIFQLSHVFRDKEIGPRHNPEFTLVEWYRVGMDFQSMLRETVCFVQLFAGPLPCEFLTYRELFERYCQIDPFSADIAKIRAALSVSGLAPYPGLAQEGIDAHLNFLLGAHIEPQLPSDRLTLVYHYPPEQAALARLCMDGGTLVAERFEIYLGEIELANGFGELTDAAQQMSRFQLANERRERAGKNPLPVDENFLRALQKGLPPCCGVAAGFDRLCMIACQATHIDQVLPFAWPVA